MEKDKIKLVKPSKEYERQAIEYKEEHFKNGEKRISACSKWYKIANYDKWLEHLENNSKKETVEENCSVATTFFGVRESDNKIVGMIDIRHELINDFLRNYAGHIGYGVRPSERRKGYATQMLSLALKYCKDELKLKEVMISCDKENEGSRKTILNAGGKLEKEYIAENGENVQLYWIELNPIIVVDYKDEYAKDISNIIIENLVEINSKDYGMDYIQKISRKFTTFEIKKNFPKRTKTLVALINNKVVGTAGIDKSWYNDNSEYWILSVFVDMEYQNKGIGKQLITKLEEYAKEIKAKKLIIPASIYASEFYHKLGYKYQNGKKELNEEKMYIMEKVLS